MSPTETSPWRFPVMPGLLKNVPVLKIVPILSNALCPLSASISHDSAPREEQWPRLTRNIKHLHSFDEPFGESGERRSVCISCVVMCWICLDTSRDLCLKAKLMFISFSMQAQKSTFWGFVGFLIFCLFVFWGLSSIWTGSIEKYMNFVKDTELYHVTIIITSVYNRAQDASGLVVPQHRLSNCLCPINSYSPLYPDFPSWHYLWQQCQVFKIPSTNKVCPPFIPRVITLGLPGKQTRSTVTQTEWTEWGFQASLCHTSLWTGNSLKQILRARGKEGKLQDPQGMSSSW